MIYLRNVLLGTCISPASMAFSMSSRLQRFIPGFAMQWHFQIASGKQPFPGTFLFRLKTNLREAKKRLFSETHRSLTLACR
jgi:hypothetical protein